MSSLDGYSGGLGDMRDSPYSKPGSGEGDVCGEDDLETLCMEREMKSLKEKDRHLTLAIKNDNMQRQLQMQRQKVQHLIGTTSVLMSGSGRKTEMDDWTFSSAKLSKVLVSHEPSLGRVNDDDCKIDKLTIQQMRVDDKLRHRFKKN